MQKDRFTHKNPNKMFKSYKNIFISFSKFYIGKKEYQNLGISRSILTHTHGHSIIKNTKIQPT